MSRPFSFAPRAGRIDWDLIKHTNIEKLTEEVNLNELERLSQNLVFAKLTSEDLDRMADPAFIKLFKLG